jgi:hypothetical protein
MYPADIFKMKELKLSADEEPKFSSDSLQMLSIFSKTLYKLGILAYDFQLGDGKELIFRTRHRFRQVR